MLEVCQEALSSPMLLLSKDLRVITASPSYLDAFKASRTAVDGQPLCKADNARWNVPAVRTLLQEVLAEAAPSATRTLLYEDRAVGARAFLSARKSAADGHADAVILLVIEVEPPLVDLQVASDNSRPAG